MITLNDLIKLLGDCGINHNALFFLAMFDKGDNAFYNGTYNDVKALMHDPIDIQRQAIQLNIKNDLANLSVAQFGHMGDVQMGDAYLKTPYIVTLLDI